MHEGLSTHKRDLQRSIKETEVLDSAVDLIKKSEAKFQALRDMEADLEKSQASASLLVESLGTSQTAFVNQVNLVKNIGGNGRMISQELKVISTDIQTMIRTAESLNSRMLSSYIGFFNENSASFMKGQK